jgi:hypothetical protein
MEVKTKIMPNLANQVNGGENQNQVPNLATQFLFPVPFAHINIAKHTICKERITASLLYDLNACLIKW